MRRVQDLNPQRRGRSQKIWLKKENKEERKRQVEMESQGYTELPKVAELTFDWEG